MRAVLAAFVALYALAHAPACDLAVNVEAHTCPEGDVGQ